MIATLRPLLDPTDPAGGLVTRDGAREEAHREVSRGIYHADDPGILRQLLDRVGGWLDHLFDRAAGVAPGGAPGMVAILLVLTGLVVLVLWRSGPLRGAGNRALDDGLTGRRPAASEHRLAADAHAAAGRYAEAVRERMRALARELESRGVLEPRPGRTADEVADEAGGHLPALAGPLRQAAWIFDEVWYGGRPATAASDAALREIDLLVHRSALRIASPGPASPPTAAPVIR
ncbi:MAG TPA: DUF4129 domain-containing protein [Mycobacteriales bacterium]|jgi:hypothetical protein